MDKTPANDLTLLQETQQNYVKQLWSFVSDNNQQVTDSLPIPGDKSIHGFQPGDYVLAVVKENIGSAGSAKVQFKFFLATRTVVKVKGQPGGIHVSTSTSTSYDRCGIGLMEWSRQNIEGWVIFLPLIFNYLECGYGVVLLFLFTIYRSGDSGKLSWTDGEGEAIPKEEFEFGWTSDEDILVSHSCYPSVMDWWHDLTLLLIKPSQPFF